MGFLLSFIVLTIVQSLPISESQEYPFCRANTSPYHEQKLPSLPLQFTAHIEATIVNKNYSMLLTEYYDNEANKGAVKIVRNGRTSYSIYNYNYNEMMAIDLKNKTCVMQEIQTMHGHPAFGRNSSRIEGIADLFRFGAKFNETFLGKATVRGIPCFHWQACSNHHHHSYLIDYYFSIPGWSNPNNDSMRVVRATINGTSNITHQQGRIINKTRSFYHVYDFFNIVAEKPSSDVFQLPSGIFCKGMKDRKAVPKMPPVFSLEIEAVNYWNKSIMLFKEYYDHHRKLIMFQYHDYRHKDMGDTRIIHDFYHGVKYNISGYVCNNVTRLTKNNTRWDGKETKDHHLELMSPSEMMFRGKISSFIYKGTASVRGIPADVWIMKTESPYSKMQVTVEYFFSHPSWNMRAGSLKKQFQVFLKSNSYAGPKNNLISSMNVLNFDGEKVPLHMFSIGACFTGERSFISLRFKGEWKKLIYKQEIPFNIAVRSAIVQACNISALRVDSVKNGEGVEGIMVWFTLLDKPPITSPDAPPENNLKQAVEALEKKVKSFDFRVYWKNPVNGKLMKTIAYKDYFSNSMKIPDKPPNDDKDDKLSKKSKGVPAGAVAGVAFIMTAIGILIGLAIAHFLMKRRGLSLFQYQRQE